MNYALLAINFVIRSKHFKILLGIMVAFIMLPACAVVVIAQTPQAILDEIFKNHASTSMDVGINPAPTGVVVLPDFRYPGDNYALGNCTYWVFARRAQVGQAIPNTWGNAATWAPRAHDEGYVVDHTPSKFAIMQTPDSAGGLGHVAFVENVDAAGNWEISEMNSVGLFIVNHKTRPPAAAAAYNFIHTKVQL